jgi:hypothetical protein
MEQELESVFDADSAEVVRFNLNNIFSTSVNSVGINYTVAFAIQKYGYSGMNQYQICDCMQSKTSSQSLNEFL